MRQPKNLTDYTTADDAAKGLEALAKDIRENTQDGMLVKWNIDIRMWHPSWDAPAKPLGRIGTRTRGYTAHSIESWP